MAWICTELIALWVMLPVLLWTDALPVASFFFWRYQPLFSPGFLVSLNAVVFAIAHMVYDSWLSVGLALMGRVVLAKVYRRHGNFWGVWILHLLLGVASFLVGLGRYFFRSPG